MADNARQPNLNLTAEEKRIFYQLFQAADTTNLGVITGEIAVPFFEKTKLTPDTLGLIWQIADRENRGLLTPSGFSVVLRLIGHAQAGRAPTEELALQSGPIPRFDGISVDTTAPSPRDAGTSSPQPTSGAPIRVPPLNPDDVNKFVSLFDKSDVVKSGTISGETAKQIFERARLPNEILGRIWNLADTKKRGVLDSTEFIIAMHLLTSYKSGAMRGIPQVLPPGLYEAAARRGGRPSMSGPRPGLDVPPVPAIPRQFTGPQRTQSPINRQQFGSPLSAQSTGGDWLVSPQEKLQFDNYFNTVDTKKSGVISGDQAVSFFTKAQLPEETLAQIWDLADIDADGQLTRDEFAVAMYLIRQQFTGKGAVPPTLPPALIPPSMRRPGSAQAVPITAPPQARVSASPQPPVPIRTAADDLFGLDSFTIAPAAAAPSPAQVAQSTGNSNAPFPTPSSPGPPTSPPGSATTFKPFIPTSTFGQSLQPQVTGASSVPSTARSPPQPSDDLLGDNDPEESSKLTQETTELANLSNQIGSLANEMQNVQTKRTATEQELSQTSQQKRDFESRLAQARAMYEQEVKSFKALEERLKISKAETTKLQQEYALIDGSRQDLQNQYNQVSAALTTDQQENANLKEKIREANAAVAQLKPALEKSRSEARQQKGLVAINKKQLATVEGERDKIQEEIDSLSKEQPTEPEEVASPVSSPPAVTSPAASMTSQTTNPFFKRTMTGSSETNVVTSPQISNDQQRAFDSLFGPSFAAAPVPTVTSPPPTSFRADSRTGSVRSPSGSGVPTPSVSPPPSSAGAFGSEPPPPPALSRQMTPNALPLTGALSETTSTHVSPPGSRFGTQDASRVGTPSRAGGGEARAASTSPFDETEERFPAIPGAFDTPSQTATSSGSEEQPVEGKDPSFDELFGGPAHQRSKSQQNNDFEEAFASLKGPNTAKTNGAPESEFPPIREINDEDDDDDSTDSEAQLGFDDNFTPVVPSQTHAPSKSDQIEPSQLAAFPTPGTTSSSPLPPPPAAESQPSPPKYDESVEKQGIGNMPPEFNGLLPNRADPTVAPDAPHSVESSTGAPIVGGEAQHDTTKTSPPPAQALSGSKAPDFEAAFSGLNLAPAKEADDDDDDDFARSETRNNNLDFDFSFDPSPSQQQRAVTHTTTSGTTSSDFFSFDDNVNGPSSSGPANPNAKPDNHDWDTLFAPLDNVKPPGDATNVAPSAASPESKIPGWALQTDTQDDPNLQRLTGMGFPRDASLAALEKFDYNIDQAIDHLTKA
ncbi:hypothetical protein BDV12DRAFT_161423 [Aspergillus spectabilis]